jgi:Uma2 family endonuclease
MTAAPQRLTEADYLAIERASEHRSEFFAGEMFAMAGGTEQHNLIVLNVAEALRGQLRGRPCRVYASDMRVKVSPTGLYTYPDIMAVCGERRFEDATRDTLLNPSVVVEVLSESPEAYDRDDKFAHYRSVESVREYLLIAQDRRRVERFVRQDAGDEWLLTVLEDPTDVVRIASINCDLSLELVYEQVELP